MNNNFRQNPEYFFFKTKREYFRNQNLLDKIDILKIEITENDNINEFHNKNYIRNDYIENITINKNILNDEILENNTNEVHKLYNNNSNFGDDLTNPIDRIKLIIQGSIKEYIPKTFKIIVKDNKND